MNNAAEVSVYGDTKSSQMDHVLFGCRTPLIGKGSFVANVLTLATGNALAQAVNLLATLVLARIFVPDDFGLLALFMAVTSFLSTIGSWRYEIAIMLPESNEEAANVQVLALLILICMCTLSLAAVALFRYQIARALGDPRIAPWLWGVPVSVFVWGLYQILTYWCSRFKQFHRLAGSRVSQSVATLASQLGMVALGFGGAASLIFGWIAGQSVGAVVLSLPAVRYSMLMRKAVKWSSIRSAFWTYKNFPMYTTPNTFVGNASQQLVLFVLRAFSSIQVVGLFAMALRAVNLPVNLLASSMRQVFYEKAATELKLVRLEAFVLKTLKLQAALGTPLLVLFLFEAKLLFGTILGSEWAKSGIYAALLAFSGYIGFLTTWMDRLIDVQGRQNLSLVWQTCRCTLVIGSLAVTLLLSGKPVLAVGVYVAVDFLCVLVWLLMVFRIAKFLSRSLWQVAVLFGSIGAIATVILLPVHFMLSPLAALIVSSITILAMEGFIFLKYSKRAQLLSLPRVDAG